MNDIAYLQQIDGGRRVYHAAHNGMTLCGLPEKIFRSIYFPTLDTFAAHKESQYAKACPKCQQRAREMQAVNP